MNHPFLPSFDPYQLTYLWSMPPTQRQFNGENYTFTNKLIH